MTLRIFSLPLSPRVATLMRIRDKLAVLLQEEEI